MITKTVDTIVKNRNFPKPQLVKIDVQGCEIDILRGMQNTLSECKHLIVELQHKEYNQGAPLSNESIKIIESMGFKLINRLWSNSKINDDSGVDDDYHFMRI